MVRQNNNWQVFSQASQLSHRRSAVIRLPIFILFLLGMSARSSDQLIPIGEDGHIVATYRFTLRHGASAAVCRAFLDRLNTTKYVQPPYCGIPDNTAVAGFEELNKVRLSSEATERLAPAIIEYIRNQVVWRPDMPIPDQDKGSLEIMNRWARSGSITAWQYSQPIMLNNDGTQDNLLMWQEPGCGEANSVGSESSQVITRSPTLAFILATNSQTIDDSKTETTFGDPQHLYQPRAVGYMRVRHNGFQPIGRHLGIFKFENRFYIDTFLDPEAVLNLNNRQVAQKILDVANTLIVLIREHGTTSRICEYRMQQTPSESNPPESSAF